MSDPTTTLDPRQLEAARLDFLGGSCRSIGDAIGVSRTTVWLWRKEPDYQEYIAQLQEDARRETLGEAVKLRLDVGKVVRASITRIGQRLAKDDMSNTELASLARASLEVYKTVCAQTGVTERTVVEHDGEISGATVVHITSGASGGIAEADLDAED